MADDRWRDDRNRQGMGRDQAGGRRRRAYPDRGFAEYGYGGPDSGDEGYAPSVFDVARDQPDPHPDIGYGGSGYGATYGDDNRGGGGYADFGRDTGYPDYTRGGGPDSFSYPDRDRGGSHGQGSFRLGYGQGGHERRLRDEGGFFAGNEFAFGDEEAARRRMRGQPPSHRGRGPKNYTRSDPRIAEDVNDRLSDDDHIDASEIEVTVSGGEVTLNGTVNSRFEKRHAEDIAEAISGVKHVQNNLRVTGR